MYLRQRSKLIVTESNWKRYKIWQTREKNGSIVRIQLMRPMNPIGRNRGCAWKAARSQVILNTNGSVRSNQDKSARCTTYCRGRVYWKKVEMCGNPERLPARWITHSNAEYYSCNLDALTDTWTHLNWRKSAFNSEQFPTMRQLQWVSFSLWIM